MSLSVVHERTFTWPSITMQISLDPYRHVKKTLKSPQCVFCLFLHLFMFLMRPMKTADNSSDVTNDTRIIKAPFFLLELLACLTRNIYHVFSCTFDIWLQVLLLTTNKILSFSVIIRDG